MSQTSFKDVGHTVFHGCIYPKNSHVPLSYHTYSDNFERFFLMLLKTSFKASYQLSHYFRFCSTYSDVILVCYNDRTHYKQISCRARDFFALFLLLGKSATTLRRPLFTLESIELKKTYNLNGITTDTTRLNISGETIGLTAKKDK